MEFISEGDMVLVQREKTYRTFVLKRGRKINLEKLSFYPDNAFGCCYGSSFQVEKQLLVPVSSAGRWRFGVGSSEVVSGSDNRDIMDDGASQELTEENIAEMKGQGASGKEIVDSMIEHSSTFKVRTKFSQEKYIKKKERKYIPVIRILRTTTKLLCEMYHDRAPSKTCFLRSDALALILSLSNVHAHSNIMVMETTQGLLTGAMLERMGGYGKLVQIFYGDFPVRNILESFGHLSESDKSILMKYPFHRVGSLFSLEEAQSSSIVRNTLASKAEGESGDGGLQLVQDGGRNEEELSKLADTPQEGGIKVSEATATGKPKEEEPSSQAQGEAMETGAVSEQSDKETSSKANCETKSDKEIRENEGSDLQTIDISPQPDGNSVVEIGGSETAGSAVSLTNVPSPVKYVKKLVWRGKVAMHGIEAFTARAYAVSGRARSLAKILPTKIEVNSRIREELVWNFIDKLKTSNSREIALIHFEPGSKQRYSQSYTFLFNYLIGRNRFGVVSTGFHGVRCKTIYILPVPNQVPLPTQLLPLNGPGLPPNHSDTLLGIIVRKKSKIFSTNDQTTANTSTTEHHSDSDDNKKDEVKISVNVKLTFDNALPSAESSAMASASSISHSHSPNYILNPESTSTSSSVSHSQSSLLSLSSVATLAVSHSESQDSVLSFKSKITAVASEELNGDQTDSVSSSDDGFVSTDSSSSSELTPDINIDYGEPATVMPHPLPLSINSTDDTHTADLLKSECSDPPSIIERKSIAFANDSEAPTSQNNTMDVPQSPNVSEPHACNVESKGDRKVGDMDIVSPGEDTCTCASVEAEGSTTLTDRKLCKEELEKEDILPPTKKVKLSTVTTDDDCSEGGLSSLEQVKSSTTSGGTEHAQSEVAMDANFRDEKCEDGDRHCGGRVERKRAKEEAYKEAEDLLCQREMDGLVVVSRFHPEPVLMSLIHFVAPSRPVVVYCNILEPLVQCYKSLKESGHTFSIQISETWTRHYQVLPERTHPEMSMDCRSGYILCTTKVKR